MALLGLVVAIKLQTDELGLQRQELKETREELHRTARAQELQLDVQRMESSRQSREQFLTARLNARVAAMQVDVAQHQIIAAANRARNETTANMFLEKSNKSGMLIEILSLEINQGFEGGPWNPSVEKEAIRQYVVKSLNSTVVRFEQLRSENRTADISETMRSVFQQFQLAAQAFREEYPDICTQFKIIYDLFSEHKNDPERAIDWCRSAEFFFRRGQQPWI
jgi:hypothetical protein